MSTIDPQSSLAELVLEHPALADPLTRLGLDFCCHGERTLASACSERGLDTDALVRTIEAQAEPPAGGGHDFDCRTATTAELCEHIVSAHHEPLRTELPRLAATLATVVRVHGDHDPRLAALARIFRALSRELLVHFDREERRLFPACVALESGGGAGDERALLDALEDDHADVGETLPVLRELAGGYDPTSARCGTHRALLEGLQALERDLHLHVHEENNVLFPRIRGRLAA